LLKWLAHKAGAVYLQEAMVASSKEPSLSLLARAFMFTLAVKMDGMAAGLQELDRIQVM
jgi:hypothetical protein